MANNVNLSQARIVRAAIMHTAGNQPKFTRIGTLQALRSPQLTELANAMSADGADKDGRLSWQPGTGPDDLIPVVRLNYRKQYSTGTSRNQRQVNENGNRPKAPTELDVTYTGFREYDLEFRTLDLMTLESAAQAYYNSINNKNVSLSLEDSELLAVAATEFHLTVEKDLLYPINASSLTALIAGVGTNKVTNSAVPKEIVLYDKEGRIRKDFWQYINSLCTVHGISGKPILIGGLMLQQFMEDQKIFSVNDLGFDAKAMYATLKAEWYYDPAIDVLLGQDKILFIEPGSACWQQIMEHKKVVKKKKAANTTFSMASVNLAQYSAPTFSMDIDLRSREYDTTKYPYDVVTPSSGLYGVFTRPAGSLKEYDGWETYTGIVSIQLRLTEPVTP
jgi:hypothetical protein